MALAPTFLRTPSLPRNALLTLAIGLLLSHLAPFATGNFAGPVRYGFWVGLVVLNWLMVGTILAALAQWRPGLPPLLAGLAAALLAAVPLTFAVSWLLTYLNGLAAPSPLRVALLYRDVALLAVIIVVPMHLLGAFVLTRPQPATDGQVPAPPPSPAPPAQAPVADGPAGGVAALPVPPGQRLLALSSEDHYLRVYTDQGDTLILRRLADAVAALPPDSGLQVHRSHWVAQTAVQRVERDGPRLVVVLTNGLQIPVSRTYRLAVQESGWPQVDAGG